VKNTIEKAFTDFDKQTILVIGDVMIDSYMWGKVDRISPEAPVPIIAVSKRENRMGGAANVGLNIRALGAKAVMCAMIGDDEGGAIFKRLLKKREMTDEGILVSSERKTTIKTRVISDNQHLLRVDEEEIYALTKNQEKIFINHLDALLKNQNFDAIVFEDYDKGNITPAIIEFVVQSATQQNIPTLVDPKKRNFLDYKGVTLFKPNFKEICDGVKIDLKKGDFAALNNATDILKNELGAKYVMVTLSELGVFITENGSFHQMPAEIRDIADVSGAGDTVISVAACSLASNLSIRQVAVIANLAGGLVCEKIGVVPIDKNALLKETVAYFKALRL
jgi:rfaE bifunctional protein kinase chain/domain